MEQGADKTVGCDGADGGETSGARAAEKSKKHGFGLVGLIVAEGDSGDCAGCDQRAEPCVAGFASFLFHVAAGDRSCVAEEGKSQRACDGADEFFVSIRFGAAELVVDVEDREIEVPGV